MILHKERNKAAGNGFGARLVTNKDIASTIVTRPDKSAGQYLLIKQATKDGYIEGYPGDYINFQFPNSKTRRGRVTKDYANTLLCNDSQGVITEDLQIRKFTPLESFRLMGFTDSDYQVLKDDDISDAQLYKMAGNSIVVNVLNNIFKAFIIQYPEIFKIKTPDEKTDIKGQITIDDII